MLSPRWKKVLRDLGKTPGRVAMMVLSIAAGVCAFATMLSAYAILTRELRQNYLATNPASASLELDRIDDALLEKVRRQPGIAAAQAGSRISARVEVRPNEWLPLALYVVRDFQDIRIHKIQPESGAWPPPAGSLLLERETLPLLRLQVGANLSIKTSDGSQHRLLLAGTAHDPGLAAPGQGQVISGYVTPDTVAGLGEDATLRTLMITVQDQPYSLEAIEGTVSRLAGWLATEGHLARLIRIPPPGEHPHQQTMTSMLSLLLVFSGIALVLGAVLTAVMVGALLAQQVRQMGIMKAMGAGTVQIASLYLGMVLLVGALATCIGMPLGIAAGRAFSRVVLTQFFNFSYTNGSLPTWAVDLMLGSGLMIPLLVVLMPISQAARMTVREAISDAATARGHARFGWIDGWVGKVGLDRTLVLSLRNVFRRPARLMFTLGLLTVAGATFISTLNVTRASQQHLVEAAASRHYDLEIGLSQPQPEASIVEIIAKVPGVARLEAWKSASAARSRPDGLAIERTFPDGGHGGLTLAAIPKAGSLIDLGLLSGRWLVPGDKQVVVLNHRALDFFPKVRVGDAIALTIRGRPLTFQVVGIARQFMASAMAYVPEDTFRDSVDASAQASAFRIVTTQHDARSITDAAKAIEEALESHHIGTRLSLTETVLRKEVDGHFNVLIAALMFISVLMAGVGLMGLTSAMSTTVAERTREFGIMRTLGGRSDTVLRNVLSEGVFIGLMSWVLATALALPLSLALGRFLGNKTVGLPFPMVISLASVFLWLVLVLLGSMAASLYPAWKATRLTIRESLTHT